MSSDALAIRVRDLCKCYEIYDRPQDRLKQSIFPRVQRTIRRQAKNYYREFWALKDVTFAVNKGEAVGIVGRNGAGKSTLLQMICGTLNPTSGSVEVEGTVAALLELGSGFNPEFTGRENVYLNASMLGLSTREIDNKYDQIAAFADIGDFLDQPVKTYSSGMLMRLAFAVNTCIDPEILIVDEALSVGDAPFQAKCFKRLRQLIELGTSLLFVSHDLSTVRSICSRALWLKGGYVEKWGEAKGVIKEYERFCWQEQGVIMQSSENAAEMAPVQLETMPSASCEVPAILFAPNSKFKEYRDRSRIGTAAVIIKNFIILNDEGYLASACDYNEELTLYYLLEVRAPVDSDFIIGVRVRDLKGNFVYSTHDLGKVHRLTGNAGDLFVASMKIRLAVTHQDYVILTGVFGFRDGLALAEGVYDFGNSVIWDIVEDAAYISVRPYSVMPLPGPVHGDSLLEFRRL